jgi:hypothetical protein
MSDLRRIGIFQISLESRFRVEDHAEASIAISKGPQPQVSGTPVSGVIGSPCTTSGSQSVETSPQAFTLGQSDLTSSLTTSRKKRPRWLL